jgi:molybdenum cofactor cytidylyltransferase
VLLAAGGSRRFGGGRQKLLLPIGEEPLVRRVARAAAASTADRVVAVVGFEAERVGEALAGIPRIELRRNARWSEGRAGSVRVGLEDISPEEAGAIFLPGDLPFLCTELIEVVLAVFRRDPSRIALPTLRGEKRNPTVFPRRLFDRLRALTGDESGLPIIREEWDVATRVPLEGHPALAALAELAHLDVDTAEDYARARTRGGSA